MFGRDSILVNIEKYVEKLFQPTAIQNYL